MPAAEDLLRSAVRADRIAEALALRKRDGGTLAECLVRLGALTEDQIVDLYHHRLQVPKISAEQLGLATTEAVASIPADMAVEFRVFPVEVDGENAILLAMADPSDTHIIGEVAFFSGRQCRRAVARESAIRDAIERHYGVRFRTPRPPEVKTAPLPLLTSAVSLAKTAAITSLRAKTSSAATESSADADAAPSHADEVHLLTQVKPELAPAAFVFEGASSLPPLASGSEEAPRQARFITQTHPVLRVPSEEEAPIPLTRPVETAPQRRGVTLSGFPRTALFPEPPFAALRTARDRDQIAATMLDYAAQFSVGAALLVMRKGALVGYDARGLSMNVEQLRQTTFSLKNPSLLQAAVVARRLYMGPPDERVEHPLGPDLPRQPGDLLVMPVLVSGRAIAVLFVEGILVPVPGASIEAFSEESGRAYERLILAARR